MARRRLSLLRHPSTAPQTPSIFRDSTFFSSLSDWSSEHLNFYRVHLLAFCLIPLVVSGIFYASNTKVGYVDSMFMCFSAATVTGLNTTLLADLTTWQQVILYILMCCGSTTFVSIITIAIRLRFFKRKFEYMVSHDSDARNRINAIGAEEAQLEGRVYEPFGADPHSDAGFHSELAGASGSNTPNEQEKKERKKKKKAKLRADMIKRVDVPVRINEMNVTGWLSDSVRPQQEGGSANMRVTGDPGLFVEEPSSSEVSSTQPSAAQTPTVEVEEILHPAAPSARPVPLTENRTMIQIDDSSKPDRTLHTRRSSEGAIDMPRMRLDNLHRTRTLDPHLDTVTESPAALSPTSPTLRHFPRTRTVEFRDDGESELRFRRTRTHHVGESDNRRPSHASLRPDLSRTLTRTTTHQPEAAINSGFGGFPNPIYAAAGFARRRIPALNNTIERNLTMQRTQTLASVHSVGNSAADPRIKPVSYISFDAVVGRNSKFHGLTTAQEEELGGIEYRALVLLLRIVAGYWIMTQLIGVLALAPWLSTSAKYRIQFEEPVRLNPTWFTFFQLASAFSNNGMSLIDTSMIPFGTAYWLIIVMSILILAGNTAFPVFLRLTIWTISKLVPRTSRTRETLQFLLDHPRRCFIYLFPSHQTWFLVFALVCLNSIDWVSFLVLDIGNPVIEAIPVGTRIIDGLFQSFAVRAAGFSIVSLSSVAPALQLLYVIMMYIAVYPIAMSIRSTNVYEEKSLGVFDDEDDSESTLEAKYEQSHSATQYIQAHARRQLAYDMWWLVLALWLVCIIERRSIGDAQTPEVTIFTLMFEVCSSYGTVGLSLGTPQQNTSLAGILRILSKLILILVMIRGRHRGLPIAIDRAVLLPNELAKMSAQARSDAASRASRSSISGSTLGLEEVEPETDQDRVSRTRQGSNNGEYPVYGFATDRQRGDDSAVVDDEEESYSSKESGGGMKEYHGFGYTTPGGGARAVRDDGDEERNGAAEATATTEGKSEEEKAEGR